MPRTPPQPEPPGGFCTYASVKLDDEVLPLARAAAALSGDITTQEWLSEVANAAAAKLLNRKPVKRRPPPPKPHGKGRPRAD